jgi:hypothetical protein
MPGKPNPRAPDFHINNVNAYHSRLKEWLRPFHGVATKNPPNYLGWRRTLEALGQKIMPEDFILAPGDRVSATRVKLSAVFLWDIEQSFRVMKSQGLQLEDSQMASAARLVKLAAAATKAACIDIQLTQGRDDHMPASNVLSEPEIDTLAALGPTSEGSTERQQNRHQPRGLAWATWVIARLGGWNCYYKPPGPITFRRGMELFYAIHRGRLLEMIVEQRVGLP